MEKIAIFTDSGCDLPDALLTEHGIYMLPLRIIYKDREYRDRVEIHADDVYENLGKEVPSTSLPSGEDTHQMFQAMKAAGYTHAIGVMISSGLSGTANSVKLMAEEHPELSVAVFDSRTLSMAEGILAVEAAKLAAKGRPFKDILETLTTLMADVDTYYYVDTLEYLMKGGRIGKVSGTIGQMLNLKPIISVNEEGVYYTIEKARGTKQAYAKLLSLLKENLDKTPCNVWVMHGGAKEEALAMVERIKDFKNILTLTASQISPALGVHTGPGLLGICLQRQRV